jgi:hypothetical protein
MRDLTIKARDAMNGINRSVATVMSAEADMQTAINAMTGSGALRKVVNSMFNTCNATNQVKDFEQCMATKVIAAKALVRDRSSKWQSSNPNSNQGGEFQTRVTEIASGLISEIDVNSDLIKKIQASQAATPNSNQPQNNQNGSPNAQNNNQNNNAQNQPLTPNGNTQPGIFNIKNEDDADAYNKVIASFRKAFLYIIEVMMLVTALVGPIFLGLSLFPVTNKPFLPWGISFLSLGFCKTCYTLIAGLS